MMRIRRMVAPDAYREADLITQLGYPATGQQIANRFERIDRQSHQLLLVTDGEGGRSSRSRRHGARRWDVECFACDRASSASVRTRSTKATDSGVSRRSTASRKTSSWLDPRILQVLRHRPGVVRERDLRLLDLRMPLLFPLETVVALVAGAREDLHLR